MSAKNSGANRFLSIASGFLFVMTATAIAWAVNGQSSSEFFDMFVRPFTLAAAGLGTGHYLGRALRSKNTPRYDFMLGFFAGIFTESVIFTLGESIGLLPYPAIVFVSAGFTFITHISPLIPNDDDISEIISIFCGPITTGFLLMATVTEFLISINLSNYLTDIEMVVLAILGLGGFYIVMSSIEERF
jgi:hypothetical protein